MLWVRAAKKECCFRTWILGIEASHKKHVRHRSARARYARDDQSSRFMEQDTTQVRLLKSLLRLLFWRDWFIDLFFPSLTEGNLIGNHFQFDGLNVPVFEQFNARFCRQLYQILLSRTNSGD